MGARASQPPILHRRPQGRPQPRHGPNRGGAAALWRLVSRHPVQALDVAPKGGLGVRSPHGVEVRA